MAKYLWVLALLLGSTGTSNATPLTNVPKCDGSPTSTRNMTQNWSNCVGTFNTRRGSTFAGKWLDGQLHGHATASFVNGNKYIGEWKDGKFHGQGTHTWVDGRKYVGEWQNGRYHGHGTKTYPSGTEYIGEWKKGSKWEGTQYDEDGDVFGTYSEGVWKIVN